MVNVYSFLFNPFRGTVCEPVPTVDLSDILTRDEAIADIDYILKRLKSRHPACMNGIPEAVTEQSRIEKENLPEEVTALQLWQAASRILAVMNDAHTGIAPFYESYNYYFPPFYFRFADGALYCAKGEFEGSAVISIGGVPVDDLYRTFKSQFWYEREEYADYFFTYAACRWQHWLAFLNADVSEQVTVVLETPHGEVSKEYSFIEWKPPEENEDDTTFLSYEIDKVHSVGIFTLTECKYNDIYRETLEKFFTEVKNEQIRTIVVDLRNNGGGNAYVASEFISYLDSDSNVGFAAIRTTRFGPVLWSDKLPETNKVNDLLFSGDVYILTSPWTFSAATIFTTMISDNGLGKIVGETSGQTLPFYGGTLSFQTPNARLLFHISGSYIDRPDESKEHLPLTPDYPSPANEALETVYRLLYS
ncbi:MAG: hypothetical protein LBC86_07885 [Oscillospiraceae bacterium]|nr:hypothetical protein [Oscillospiraceae bacterium]